MVLGVLFLLLIFRLTADGERVVGNRHIQIIRVDAGDDGLDLELVFRLRYIQGQLPGDIEVQARFDMELSKSLSKALRKDINSRKGSLRLNILHLLYWFTGKLFLV